VEAVLKIAQGLLAEQAELGELANTRAAEEPAVAVVMRHLLAEPAVAVAVLRAQVQAAELQRAVAVKARLAQAAR
jgi:hypothetical protein